MTIWRAALRGRFYNLYPLDQDRKIDKMEILVILIIIIRQEFYHIIRIFIVFMYQLVYVDWNRQVYHLMNITHYSHQ